MVLSPAKMRVLIPDPIHEQPSKVDIVRSEFASKRLEMEQKYKKLQELVEKSEENSRVHEHKARRMTEDYTRVKDENESLYIANKKLWEQNRNTKIGRCFGTQRREGESSQRESNHWKTQVSEAQTKACHWEKEHSVVFEDLSKCRKSRAQWKGKAKAKEIQYQEVLEEKTALQKAI